MPLVHTIEIEETKTGRRTQVLHTFYALEDGSCLAFFEAPDQPFEFKQQHDFDLHIALEVDATTLDRMFARAKQEGREVRGVSDHEFIRSIYFRDPNGYVVELACPTTAHAEAMDPARNDARGTFERWSQRRIGLTT